MTMPGGHGPWTVMRSYRRDSSVTEQKLPKGTARRIAAFARPYRWDLTVFLLTVDRQRGDRRGHPGARRPGGQRDQLARRPVRAS